MKFFSLPRKVGLLVFDIDNTLYSNKAYADFQEDSQVEKLAERLGLSPRKAAERLETARRLRSGRGLPKLSMGAHFLEFGVDMATIIKWREESIHPGDWLEPNPALDRVLAGLAARYKLAALTNNPKSVGIANLAALGVGGNFAAVLGLDDTGRSKPALEPFLAVCALLSTEPSAAVSIGDRYDVDIAPALAVGMGGILVDGVEDVLALPEKLGAGA